MENDNSENQLAYRIRSVTVVLAWKIKQKHFPPSAQTSVYCFSFLLLKDDSVHISFLEPLNSGFAGKEVRAITMLCMRATRSYILKNHALLNPVEGTWSSQSMFSAG